MRDYLGYLWYIKLRSREALILVSAFLLLVLRSMSGYREIKGLLIPDWLTILVTIITFAVFVSPFDLLMEIIKRTVERLKPGSDDFKRQVEDRFSYMLDYYTGLTRKMGA